MQIEIPREDQMNQDERETVGGKYCAELVGEAEEIRDERPARRTKKKPFR